MNTILNFLTEYGPSITAVLGVVASIVYSLIQTRKAIAELKNCDDIASLKNEVKHLCSENKTLQKMNEKLLSELTRIRPKGWTDDKN